MADPKVIRTQADLVEATRQFMSTKKPVIATFEGVMANLNDATLTEMERRALEDAMGRPAMVIARA